MDAIDRCKQPWEVKLLRKLPLIVSTIWNLLRIYLAKPIDAELLRGVIR
ncbi:MAG: hypothetical protein QNJ46_23830 [Leptolyngbyaceae cyanobacterium MO_188.B28]|nr:hypothetical protein [Leptolyngbyaceae cyanobacterium MO_188.B28]